MPQDSKLPTECWRYEYRDGGGPWFFPDGRPRNINKTPPYEQNENALCGCDTLENLKQYMSSKGIDTSEMYLVHYFDIEVIEYTPETGHIIFSKKGFE